MAKINVDTKKIESKDEMDKFFEELNAWAEKHKERGILFYRRGGGIIIDEKMFYRSLRVSLIV